MDNFHHASVDVNIAHLMCDLERKSQDLRNETNLDKRQALLSEVRHLQLRLQGEAQVLRDNITIKQRENANMALALAVLDAKTEQEDK